MRVQKEEVEKEDGKGEVDKEVGKEDVEEEEVEGRYQMKKKDKKAKEEEEKDKEVEEEYHIEQCYPTCSRHVDLHLISRGPIVLDQQIQFMMFKKI